MDIATNPDLKTNFNIFSTLMGTQKGEISGKDLIFLRKSYHQYNLQTNSNFYKEAFFATTQLNVRKGVQDVEQWDNEHLFYNTLFTY